MSIDTVLTCDICKRNEKEMLCGIKVIRRKFKIKHFGLWNGHRNPWEDFDICMSCLNEIRRRVAENDTSSELHR